MSHAFSKADFQTKGEQKASSVAASSSEVVHEAGSMDARRSDLALDKAPKDPKELDKLGEQYLEARRKARPATLNDAEDSTFKENCGLLSVGAVTNETGSQIAAKHGFPRPDHQPPTAWFGADDTTHTPLGGIKPSILTERFEAQQGSEMTWIASQMEAGQTLSPDRFDVLKRDYGRMKFEFMDAQPSTNVEIQNLMAAYLKKTMGEDNISVECGTDLGDSLSIEEGVEAMRDYPTGTQFVVFLTTSDGRAAHYVYAERATDVLAFVDYQPKRSKADTFRYKSPESHATSINEPTPVPFTGQQPAPKFDKMNFLAIIPTAEYMRSVVSS